MRSVKEYSYHHWNTVLPIIKRSIAMFFVLDILWRWYSHLMVSQLESPLMLYMQYNPTFHIYKILGLQDVIVNNTGIAYLFDWSLLLSFLLVIWKPTKIAFNIIAFILFFIYSIIFPVNLAFPAHYLSGMVVVSFVFLCNSDKNFPFAIEGLRYYVMWVYSSAFVWKLLNGAMWNWDNGVVVLQNNLAQYLYLNPDSTMSSIYYWALQHPSIVNVIACATYLLEGVFIIGFFTKKCDSVLIVLIFLIHFGLYVAVDTLFVEWYIFILLLISYTRWQKWAQRFPRLNIA